MDWWEEARTLEPRVAHVVRPRLEIPVVCLCGREFKNARGRGSHRRWCGVSAAVYAFELACVLDSLDRGRAVLAARSETIDTPA